MISYPPLVRKQPKVPPHTSQESKRLLEEYHIATQNSTRERNRLKMHSSSRQKSAANSTAKEMLDEAERAMLQGRNDEALSCYLEALRMGEESAAVLAQIGSLYQTRGQTTEALSYYSKSLNLDPLESSVYLRRAECHIESGNPGEAFVEFEKYFKMEAPSKELLVRCGKCALDAELLDEAEKYLMAAIKLEEADPPNEAYAWYNLGELQEKKQNDDLASQNYNNVCRADKTFPLPYIDQAEQEYANGNFPMALHLYEAVAKMMPHDSTVYIRLADIYEKLGDEYSISVFSCLSKALALNGAHLVEHEETLVRRGKLLYISFGQLDEAIADFTLCLEGNPSNPAALNHRALAYRARRNDGDVGAAVRDYTALVNLDGVSWSDKAEPYSFLASCAFVDGDLQTAAVFYAFAISCGRKDPRDELMMVNAFAEVCIQRGDSFDETYEPRAVHNVKEDKGKKQDPNNTQKAVPIVSCAYHILDRYYQSIRDREPTVHSQLEYQFIDKWKPFKDEVDRKREEAEATRLGKKVPKRK